jgi:hypothetical protein
MGGSIGETGGNGCVPPVTSPNLFFHPPMQVSQPLIPNEPDIAGALMMKKTLSSLPSPVNLERED